MPTVVPPLSLKAFLLKPVSPVPRPSKRHPNPNKTFVRLLGRLMGKALKDGRMLDLPLALPLCALVVGLRRDNSVSSTSRASSSLGQSDRYAAGSGRSKGTAGDGVDGEVKEGIGGGGVTPLTLDDVRLMDASLGRSLESVAALAGEVERAKVILTSAAVCYGRGVGM